MSPRGSTTVNNAQIVEFEEGSALVTFMIPYLQVDLDGEPVLLSSQEHKLYFYKVLTLSWMTNTMGRHAQRYRVVVDLSRGKGTDIRTFEAMTDDKRAWDLFQMFSKAVDDKTYWAGQRFYLESSREDADEEE